MTNGTAYTFTVTATNTVGTGPPSAASNSITPAGLPGAPIIGTATTGDARATVTFTPPASDGGSPIIEYTATSSPGGKTGKGASSPITVTGLTNGTAYSFTVAATNAVGTGPPSAASNSVTPGGEYSWRSEAAMPTGADWAGSAVAAGKLYVIGGGAPANWGKIRIYNPSTKTWSQKDVGEMGYLLRAAALSNMIYIFDASDPGDQGWTYDLTTKILSPLGGTVPNLEWTSEPAIYDGKIYFFGGYGPLNTTWEFDPATLGFTQKADMPTAGYGSSTAVLDGKIYVIGGNWRNDKIEIFNPKTNKWASSLSFSKLNLTGWDTAAPLGGKIAIAEGTGRTHLFDPVTGKLATKQSMPRAHGSLVTGELMGGRLYVAGGETGPKLFDSFGPNPAESSIELWAPVPEGEVRESSEPDCRSSEVEHLRRVEEILNKAAAMR